MTPQEILEYNKRCAEFLIPENTLSLYYFPKFGLYLSKYGEVDYEECFRIDEMKFHSDWNWIMEVVDTIEKIADWNLECLNVEERLFQMCIPLSNTYITSEDKKEAVVQAINQFLIWYQNQKG